MPPRHRTAGRVARLLAALVLILALLPDLPASAATPVPRGIALVSASRSAVGLSWGEVKGATKYTVKYSTKSSMKGAKSKKSTKPAIELTGLKASTAYYVTVTATGEAGKSKASAKLKVKTMPSSLAYAHLAPTGLKASSITADSAKVSWNSRGSGVTYRLTVATKSSFANAKTYLVWGTSKTIKGLLGAKTYYVRLRVTNSVNAPRSVSSSTLKLKTAADAATVDGPATITVGSYNVGSETMKPEEHPWPARRTAVAATILAQRPDVIGLQEVSQGRLGATGPNQPNRTQAEDLMGLLGGAYWMANEARYNCANPTGSYNCKAEEHGAANSQKIVYNPTTVKLLKQGSKKTTSKKIRMEEERYVEWAIFAHKATGKRFFFVNVHLDPGKDEATIEVRAAQMREILAVIDAKNPDGLPTYVVGDFNSHKEAVGGNRPYDAMIAAGYVDPLGNTWKSEFQDTAGATVENRINTQYASHNAWKRVAPKKPWLNGLYIDYIWTSQGIRVPEWETVVNVDSNGNFVGVIPSDHNMLRATTVIG
ncbi:MAG TPA: fibronectin type III domain-containing protein [Arachnia sp.]|nr:fibronectin type III domain-containing protein [Arachnia sp.]HMR13654.1 fibronectin type III domain-containing protein [Arachnia sp.]